MEKNKYYNPEKLNNSKDYKIIMSSRGASARERINEYNTRIFDEHRKEFMNDRKMLICTICFKECTASDSVSDHGRCLMCMPCYQKIREAVNKTE